MKILDRYIFNKTAVYLLIIFPAFTFVSGLVEFIEIMRKVQDLNIKLVFLYILSKIPENAYYIVPLSLLVSIFIVIRDLQKNREIYPIVINGISLSYISGRFIIFSFIITMLQVINIELIMPKTVSQTEKIYSQMRKISNEESKNIGYNIWLKIDNYSFLYFDIYDTSKKKGKGLMYIKFNENLRPVYKVEAENFEIDGGGLFGSNGKKVEIRFLDEVKVEQISEKFQIPVHLNQDEIKKLIKEKKPVSISELYNVANVSKKYGYEAPYFWSKLFQKLATVISSTILTIFTLYFFWSNRYTKIAVGFVGVLGYWYGTAIVSSVAENGTVPYFLIFTVDLVYLITGLSLLKRVNLLVE